MIVCDSDWLCVLAGAAHVGLCYCLLVLLRLLLFYAISFLRTVFKCIELSLHGVFDVDF